MINRLVPSSHRPAVFAVLSAVLLTALAIALGGASASAGSAAPIGGSVSGTSPTNEQAQGGPPSGAEDRPRSGEADREPASPAADLLDTGRQLYLTSCVNCHGVDGRGTPDGPSLLASGEAKTDFYLQTGRMPLTIPVPQAPAKPRAFNDEDIDKLVAYVGSLCEKDRNPCPEIPHVDTEHADISEGNELYLANSAPCHNSMGVGGALSYGNNAPSVQQTSPVQIAEAIRTGPGQMPRFGNDVLTDEQVDDLVKYVTFLHDPESPGGLSLGYTGPVAEGFVALLVGLAALLALCRWITREPSEHHVAVRPAPIDRTTSDEGNEP